MRDGWSVGTANLRREKVAHVREELPLGWRPDGTDVLGSWIGKLPLAPAEGPQPTTPLKTAITGPLLFVFISVNVAVLVLRRDTVEHEHFRVWTFVPIAGVASCILLLTQQDARVWLFGAVALAVGVVLFFVAGRFSKGEPPALPS